MTVLGFLACLTWAAVAAFFVSRIDRIAHRWLDLTNTARQPSSTVEIPDDLQGLAMAETEKWAQDQTLEAIRERYDRLKDWNRVRAALGVAERSV